MTPNWEGTRFGGDGRRTIAPLLGSGFSYGSESTVRVAVAQQTIINFHRKGYIKLYDKENPVWVVLEYCKVKNVRYHIRNKRVYLTKSQINYECISPYSIQRVFLNKPIKVKNYKLGRGG